jgi:hypothetical protein
VLDLTGGSIQNASPGNIQNVHNNSHFEPDGVPWTPRHALALWNRVTLVFFVMSDLTLRGFVIHSSNFDCHRETETINQFFNV